MPANVSEMHTPAVQTFGEQIPANHDSATALQEVNNESIQDGLLALASSTDATQLQLSKAARRKGLNGSGTKATILARLFVFWRAFLQRYNEAL